MFDWKFVYDLTTLDATLMRKENVKTSFLKLFSVPNTDKIKRMCG